MQAESPKVVITTDLWTATTAPTASCLERQGASGS